MNATDKQSYGGRLAGSLLLGFVLIYLLCPLVFVQLLMVAYPATSLPPAVNRLVDVFFLPVSYLERHVPPYRHLLEAEANC